MSNNQPPPHPERPFSPSPPRENRHSISRPPSLLFGAPPVSTAATSNAFSFADLPSTPPRPGPIDFSSSRKTPTSVDSKRRRSDSESSTTSSASLPLGATSILSAIAASTPPTSKSQSHQSPTSHQKHVRISSDVTTLKGSDITDPGSPQSFYSGFSSSSSTIDGMPPVKSLHRLHQPTVVRSTSGRGLAFLPHPAQASNRNIASRHSITGTPTSNLFTPSHRGDRSGSVATLEHIQRHANEFDLGQPIAVVTPAHNVGSPSPSKRNSDDLINLPTLDDSPSTSFSEHGSPLHEAQKSPILAVESLPNTVDNGGQPFAPDSDVAKNEATAAFLEETAAAAAVPELSAISPETDHSFTGEVSPVQSPHKAEQITALLPIEADPSSSKLIGEKATERVAMQSVDEPSQPRDSDMISFNENRGTNLSQEFYPPFSTHNTDKIGTTLVNKGKTSQRFPYKARYGSRVYDVQVSSASVNSREVTLCASLNHSANPLPQLTAYRVEIALSWGNPQLLRWLPGRKYIPNWDLKVVGNTQNPVVLDIRVLIKTVVSKLPILWRFAAWL